MQKCYKTGGCFKSGGKIEKKSYQSVRTQIVFRWYEPVELLKPVDFPRFVDVSHGLDIFQCLLGFLLSRFQSFHSGLNGFLLLYGRWTFLVKESERKEIKIKNFGDPKI